MPSHDEHGVVGLVLAGGGARAAYEAGVVRFVLEELGRRAPVSTRFQVFAGTSAGGLNTSFLAANADDPARSARRLADYWCSLTTDRVFRFGRRELLHSTELLLGQRWGRTGNLDATRSRNLPGGPHASVAGLFDTAPLRAEMTAAIPWDRLQRNLAEHQVRGLAVCATEVCTGQSVIFQQMAPGVEFPQPTDASRRSLPVKMSVEHAMASAAIPFVFPSIQIGGLCYVDGGMFLNTPLVPAIRAGADRLLVVSLNRSPESRLSTARSSCRRNPFPGATFLLGRLLGSMMDRQLDYELRRLEMFNQLIGAGRRLHGSRFLRELDRAALEFRNAPYRRIQVVHIRPSRDLNELALEALRESPGDLELPGSTGKVLRRILLSQPLLESELTSLLLFSPAHARKLVDLGYRDAEERQGDLTALFGAPTNPITDGRTAGAS